MQLVPVPNARSSSSKIQTVVRVKTGGGGGGRDRGPEFKTAGQDFPRLGTGTSSARGSGNGGGFNSDGFPGFAGGGWSGRGGTINTDALSRRTAEDFPSLRPDRPRQPPPPAAQLRQQLQQRPPKTEQPPSRKGHAVIDDDEAFPSLRVAEETAKAAARAKAIKEQKEELEEEEEEEEETATTEEAQSYLSRLNLGGGKGWPRNLSQATACLTGSEAFPSLASGERPTRNPTNAGAWGGPRNHTASFAATAGSYQNRAAWEAHDSASAPGEVLSGFDWIKNPASKAEALAKKKAKTKPKQPAPGTNLVSISARNKARQTARAKQHSTSEEPRRPSPRASPPLPPQSHPTPPPPGLSQPIPEEKPTPAAQEGPPPGLSRAPAVAKPPGLSMAAVARPPGLSKTPESKPPGLSGPPGLPPPSSAANGANQMGYLRPRDFDQRNKALFHAILCSPGDMDAFKAASRRFRSGDLGAADYLGSIESLLGRELVKKQLPELIALLPDIRRQSELVRVATGLLGSQGGSWSQTGPLTSCGQCGQQLRPWDAAEHNSGHRLDTNFPSLG